LEITAHISLIKQDGMQVEARIEYNIDHRVEVFGIICGIALQELLFMCHLQYSN